MWGDFGTKRGARQSVSRMGESGAGPGAEASPLPGSLAGDPHDLGKCTAQSRDPRSCHPGLGLPVCVTGHAPIMPSARHLASAASGLADTVLALRAPQTHLLSQLPIPDSQVLTINPELPVEAAAEDYAAKLRQVSCHTQSDPLPDPPARCLQTAPLGGDFFC